MLLLHYNTDVWESPESFDPDRFVKKKLSPYDFAPYGGGARRCIGAAFATHAMKIVIGTLISNARLELERPLDVFPSVTNITMGPNKVIPLVYRGRHD